MSECLACGSCCRTLLLKLNICGEEDKEFYRARGFKVDGNRVDVRVAHVCPQLIGDKCGLHDGAKPSLCRKYPTYLSDEELLPGCGYRR